MDKWFEETSASLKQALEIVEKGEVSSTKYVHAGSNYLFTKKSHEQ
jgi:hypothetical protein